MIKEVGEAYAVLVILRKEILMTIMDKMHLNKESEEVAMRAILLIYLNHFSVEEDLVVRKGSKSGASGRCHGCQGPGMKMSTRLIGPGMIQQMQHVINEKDKCPRCKGNKISPEKKVLELHVEKGMQHRQKIVFHGEANESPDTIAGDIVFVLQLKEHPKFKGRFNNLDGRQLLVIPNPSEIIKHGMYCKAINETDEGNAAIPEAIYQGPTTHQV